jgi:glycosyltransferase involved in cell wall biosynthesis
MTIMGYHGDISGCFEYRLRIPFDKMKENGIDCQTSIRMETEHVTGHKWKPLQMRAVQLASKFIPEEKFNFNPRFDVSIFQRFYETPALNNALFMRKYGKKTVYELDDNFEALEKWNPCFEDYQDKKEFYRKFIANCDAMTVSTDALRKQYLPLNPNIYVLPNSLDFKAWDEVYSKKESYRKRDGKIRIAWAGSPTHAGDIYWIKDVICKLLRSYPNLIMKFIGTEWHKLYSEFKNYLGQIEYESWQPFDKFAYGFIDCDIGIAPLHYCKFNEGKSNIKYLEYSALGLPTVATDIDPYSEIDIENTGYKVKNNNPAAWYKTIEKLIKFPSVRARIGDQARAYVKRHYDIENNWRLWVDAYEDIMRIENAYQIKKAG